jgi:xanthosine utilization system XapX-like protein
LAAFWEAGLVAAQLAERRGFFGLGRLGPTVEPVVWQLGIPGSYAWLSLLGPAVGATACLAWSKSWPALGSGLAIGALFALLRVSLPLRPGPGTRILETLLGAQDLSRGLRWALAARFLPAGQRIATGGAGAMAVGGVGLALWIATIGALGYQYQDAALHHLRVLYDIYPVAQTYIEMSSYRSGLVAQVKSGGSLPPDLRSWLNDSYTTATKDEPGSDYFGTPYRASYDDRGHAQLRSCGRDRRCHSSDDLIMPL